MGVTVDDGRKFDLRGKVITIKGFGESVLRPMVDIYTAGGLPGLCAEIREALASPGPHGEYQFSPQPDDRELDVLAKCAISRGRKLGLLTE
jgi:hypothetical protein